MGLDSYLTKKTYVKNWPHQRPEQRHVITITGPQADNIKRERISYICEEVAYWRKANAIHAWFVKNVQGGQDDQRDYYVSIVQLADLLDAVNLVLNHSKLAPGQVRTGEVGTKEGWETVYEPGQIVENPIDVAKVLPTASGFFFGSTDYDERYWKQLEYTRDVLTKELAEDDINSHYEYHADW